MPEKKKKNKGKEPAKEQVVDDFPSDMNERMNTQRCVICAMVLDARYYIL
jgi:hypothetical protein